MCRCDATTGLGWSLCASNFRKHNELSPFVPDCNAKRCFDTCVAKIAGRNRIGLMVDEFFVRRCASLSQRRGGDRPELISPLLAHWCAAERRRGMTLRLRRTTATVFCAAGLLATHDVTTHAQAVAASFDEFRAGLKAPVSAEVTTLDGARVRGVIRAVEPSHLRLDVSGRTVDIGRDQVRRVETTRLAAQRRVDWGSRRRRARPDS